MTEVNSKLQTVFDSTHQQVGEAYARALLGIGQSEGRVDGLVDELVAFDNAVRQMPSLAGVLSSPRISTADKETLVRKALGGRSSKSFENFIRLLVRRSRFAGLTAIRVAAVRLQDEYAGRVRGVVTSAEPLDDDSIRQIAESLGRRVGKQLLLSSEVDPDIIGGVVVRVGDTVYDSSVKSRLAQLKRTARKNAADAIRAQLSRFASSN